MGKKQQHYANSSGKAGDFFYKEGSGKPGSDIAVKANLFDDGDPLVDQPSVKAMCGYVTLTMIAVGLTYIGLQADTFLVTNDAATGAKAGVSTVTHEDGTVQPIEGSWRTGGDLMTGCAIFSFILSGIGITIMCCNMGEFNHRFIQFTTCLAYATTVVLFTAAISYEMMSRGERNDDKYDHSKGGQYKIQRNWMWSTSYLCVLLAALISLLAAISAFCSTLEAKMCEDDPVLACKHCFTCAQQQHKVEPFVMPTLPSQGMHMEGTEPEAGALHMQNVNNRSVRLPPIKPGNDLAKWAT